jgi:ribosomal protein S27AE
MKMQRFSFFTVDLTKIKGRGEFRCPKCGTMISPDDISKRAYTVLEPVMKGNDLEKIVLQCNKCGSQIYVTGFHAMNRLRL